MRTGHNISTGQRQGWFPDIEADNPQARASLGRLQRHSSDTCTDIEKAAGERRSQFWTVSGKRDDAANILARRLAPGLKCGGVPNNPPVRAIRVVEQLRRLPDDGG